MVDDLFSRKPLCKASDATLRIPQVMFSQMLANNAPIQGQQYFNMSADDVTFISSQFNISQYLEVIKSVI